MCLKLKPRRVCLRLHSNHKSVNINSSPPKQLSSRLSNTMWDTRPGDLRDFIIITSIWNNSNVVTCDPGGGGATRETGSESAWRRFILLFHDAGVQLPEPWLTGWIPVSSAWCFHLNHHHHVNFSLFSSFFYIKLHDNAPDWEGGVAFARADTLLFCCVSTRERRHVV